MKKTILRGIVFAILRNTRSNNQGSRNITQWLFGCYKRLVGFLLKWKKMSCFKIKSLFIFVVNKKAKEI